MRRITTTPPCRENVSQGHLLVVVDTSTVLARAERWMGTEMGDVTFMRLIRLHAAVMGFGILRVGGRRHNTGCNGLPDSACNDNSGCRKRKKRLPRSFVLLPFPPGLPMNRFAIVAVAAGLAVSSALASQGRGQFGGEGGSAPGVPPVVHPAGTTRGGGGSYASPGVMGASFEVTGETVTVLEEHYRKQLIGAGWRIESTGGDANGAFSRFAVPAGAITRIGTLRVALIKGGWVSVAIRLVESTPPPPPTPAKTGSEMMDWMLRQLPSRADTPALSSALPRTFPTELLPGRLKTSRILTSGHRWTVAGTMDNTAPSELATFFLGLRRAGWISSPRTGFTSTFALGEFCRNDTRASLVFHVEPKRVVMAGVTTDTSPDGRCASEARRPGNFFVPIVVVPSAWAPVIDGGGGGSHWRSGIRVSTSASLASVLADVESQITAVAYKAVSRTSDATQSLVRFESTTESGSPAMLLLSLTTLPWSSQIDAVMDVIASPVR